MAIWLENEMLHAIAEENLNLVSILLSKGANPNATVCSGKTCLGEAAFRGLTDIAKLLIAKSLSDKQVLSDNEENEYHCASKNREKEAPLNKKLDMLSNTEYTTERDGEQTLCKSFYKLGHGLGSSSEDSKVQSPQSDLEWDEDIGKVAANTKEDDEMTDMYQWYAAILETTGAAVVAASDSTYSIDQEDAFGRTALSYACDQNNLEIFKALVEAGCKVDGLVLHSACINNRLEFVEVLLAAGCNVNQWSRLKTTALHIAARHSLEMVTMIADHGAKLEVRDEYDRTALFVAATLGNTAIVEFLISRGARFNVEDSQGHTPLCLAVKFNYIDIADILLKSGARISHFQCMLHHAVRNLRYEMAWLLANRGCNLNVRNFVGDTPLLVAMGTQQRLPFVKLLLNKGANVNACNSYSGLSVLHIGVDVIADPEEFEAFLNTLMDHSIFIDKRANTRDTALNRAILLRKDQFAMQLIRYGADVNLYDLLTDVPGNLIIASTRLNNKLADMLIKAGHKPIVLSDDHYSNKTLEWITEMFKAPLSLANICRIRIRNMRKRNNLRDFVRDLPVPELIKNFLMMEELLC